MHYYYGNCDICKSVTYRYPTESFYRHLDGTPTSGCTGAPVHTGFEAGAL